MNIKRKLLAGLMAACVTAGLTTGLTACGSDSADGTVNLTFQIWDVAQRDGMQAMCDAYTEQHPNVHIEVQVTSWDEYGPSWRRPPSPTRCPTSSGCTPTKS